jgi:SPOR domain
MADRYQDRPLSADGFGRGGDQHQRAEADPLAELARLIGQNDPLAAGRGNPPPSRAVPPNQFQPPVEEDKPAGPPPWMRRANPQEIPKEAQRETLPQTPREAAREASREAARDFPPRDFSPRDLSARDLSARDFPGGFPEQPVYPASPHPLKQRYGAELSSLEPDFQHEEPAFGEAEAEPDPARYDEALFGQIDSAVQGELQGDPAFPDDPYAYQDGYEDENDEPEPKRRGGLMTVFAVLALAVIGTGGAFAYRTFVGSSRSGEPPIIRADNAPTKVMPAPQDGSVKVPDRLAMGDGTEKLVPREETPVDVNSRSIGGGPRVAFPALDQNNNPPTVSSVSPNGMPPAGAGGAPGNGTLSNNEPRRVRTLSVRGDQPTDGTGTAAPNSAPPPAAKPSAAAKMAARTPPNAANANTNSPMSLSPQSAQDSVPVPPAGDQRAGDQRARVAAVNPTQSAPPAANAVSSSSSGGYMVQVSSQKSEGDAQASYKALQTKFPSVLGARDPMINRADLGEKGIVYQARVGPFGSRDEALQFCVSLKSAGGQCFVPKN